MTRSILLTGGLGYVGGRVAEVLARNREFSISVTTRNPDRKDLPEWLSRNQCHKLNLQNDNDIKNICKNSDIIIHFAAINEIDSILNPEQAILINTLGTMKLVHAAREAGVRRFIYFSTAHVYRSPLEGVISESMVPRPTHPYAITHRAAEDFVLAGNGHTSMDGIVIRLSNSIGYPIDGHVNRWSLAGNDMCRQAMTMKQIRLKTSGLQQRDFITLSDVARAVVHMIGLPHFSIGEGIFNLGGENVMSILDLAKRIQTRCTDRFGFTPSIHRPDPPAGERNGQLSYSIDRLKSTGFILEGDLDQEIDGTLSFCRKNFLGTS
jgi:UDP-glucose 4-epimerase